MNIKTWNIHEDSQSKRLTLEDLDSSDRKRIMKTDNNAKNIDSSFLSNYAFLNYQFLKKINNKTG